MKSSKLKTDKKIEQLGELDMLLRTEDTIHATGAL